MKEKFIEMYGDIDQHLTDEKWMGFYGIWVSAYAEARKEIGEWMEEKDREYSSPESLANCFIHAIEPLLKGEMPE